MEGDDISRGAKNLSKCGGAAVVVGARPFPPCLFPSSTPFPPSRSAEHDTLMDSKSATAASLLLLLLLLPHAVRRPRDPRSARTQKR